MSIYRGFVQSVLVRNDGWLETVIEAVHTGNTKQSFFIPNLDGDLTQAHKRLGQMSLLRDALARVEPVEIEYDADPEQGNLIRDVTIYERVSTDGRRGTLLVTGTVIGVSITERGPESGTSPYLDEADVAAITLLRDDGTVEAALLDLQRPDPDTAQASLTMLQKAHRSRRPVELMVSQDFQDPKRVNRISAAASTGGGGLTWVQSCRWVTLPASDLQYCYAFVERLGQRYESYVSSDATAAWFVKVTYTTAPGQTPEGDISDNGSFTPQRLSARVHSDSPLLARLEAALRDGLQVKLGLSDDYIHEVEVVGGLGSVARPIWIVTEMRQGACGDDSAGCGNVPSITGPSASDLNNVPRSLRWCAQAYFREGIWRFVVKAPGEWGLKIDCKPICHCGCSEDASSAPQASSTGTTPANPQHAYLTGLHYVELELKSYSCSSSFAITVYRIR